MQAAHRELAHSLWLVQCARGAGQGDEQTALRAVADADQNLRTLCNTVKPLIDKIEDIQTRAVLRLCWLRGYTAEQVVQADITDHERRSVYYYLRQGEKLIAEMLC